MGNSEDVLIRDLQAMAFRLQVDGKVQSAELVDQTVTVVRELRRDRARLDWLMARDCEFDRDSIDATMGRGEGER